MNIRNALFFGLMIAAASVQAQMERGKYLVEGILTCGNCHTPRGPGGVLDTARRHALGLRELRRVPRRARARAPVGERRRARAALHDPDGRHGRGCFYKEITQ